MAEAATTAVAAVAAVTTMSVGAEGTVSGRVRTSAIDLTDFILREMERGLRSPREIRVGQQGPKANDETSNLIDDVDD